MFIEKKKEKKLQEYCNRQKPKKTRFLEENKNLQKVYDVKKQRFFGKNEHF